MQRSGREFLATTMMLGLAALATGPEARADAPRTVSQYPCDPTNEAQQWSVDRYADGLTRIINVRDKLCLDAGDQPAGGLRPAVLTQCQHSFWQLWEIVRNDTTLMIRNYYDGCLDIAVGGDAGHKPGVGVVLYGVCGTNLVWLQWEPIPVRERLYAFRNNISQLCLEPTR